ncbi:MAG: hypothetical protein EHM41_18030 [Chloroflexi bacterium]|nr:MAG: hypothetical protein EHM41_18030 [Chloroflexota bacterium]
MVFQTLIKLTLGLSFLFAINTEPDTDVRIEAASLTPGSEIPACTVVVPIEVTEIDGAKDFTYVQPGDVLCLVPGVRSNMKIQNLHGTPEKPIIIRNEGGNVIITGEDLLTGGIGIKSSSYVRISGAGVVSQCGAEYEPEEQNCGIEIVDTHKGVKINTPDGVLNDIELDHIFIHETSTLTETRGITIHPLERQLISGIYVHHNYVTNTLAEGIYIGAEPRGKPYEELGKISDVDISYNRVENTGYDGIKVKVAIENVNVHHNVVLNNGLSRTPAHQGGIKLAMSVGNYYNNLSINNFEGIRMGRELENSNSRYFNNVVVNSESVGIGSTESHAEIFNNTVVYSSATGIDATGTDSKVFDNIIVETMGTPINSPRGYVGKNFIGSIYQVGFINPINGDYRLLPDSPAIDAGEEQGPFVSIDYEDKPRVQGVRQDLGAYEYVDSEAEFPEIFANPTDLNLFQRTGSMLQWHMGESDPYPNDGRR